MVVGATVIYSQPAIYSDYSTSEILIMVNFSVRLYLKCFVDLFKIYALKKKYLVEHWFYVRRRTHGNTIEWFWHLPLIIRNTEEERFVCLSGTDIFTTVYDSILAHVP